MAAFVIKAEIADPNAAEFAFAAMKTMYGGKLIARGDDVFLFASENHGGQGLCALGVVMEAAPTPRLEGVARQTPRVSVDVRRTAVVARPLGRAQLKSFRTWDDGRPESELNFKLYRQATDKIVGVSATTADWLRRIFT